MAYVHEQRGTKLMKNPHNRNAPMMRRKPGCLNSIAKERAASTATLNHPNFAALHRGERQMVGKPFQTAAGRTSYVYGADRPRLRMGTAAQEALLS
jgi:hypothetical protein